MRLDVEKVREKMREAVKRIGPVIAEDETGVSRQAIYNFTKDDSEVVPRPGVQRTYTLWLQKNGFLPQDDAHAHEAHGPYGDSLVAAAAEFRRLADMLENDSLPRAMRAENLVAFLKAAMDNLTSEFLSDTPADTGDPDD